MLFCQTKFKNRLVTLSFHPPSQLSVLLWLLRLFLTTLLPFQDQLLPLSFSDMADLYEFTVEWYVRSLLNTFHYKVLRSITGPQHQHNPSS